MRGALLTALGAAVLALPAVAIAAPKGGDPAPAPVASAPPTPDAAPVDPNGRLWTPEQEGRQNLMHGVIEQPFRDFNLIRSKIPPVLLEAIADPYERPGDSSCAALSARLAVLNDALGPDLDEPASTDHPGVLTRGEGAAKTGMLDAMRSEVQEQIPFDGFIRFMTGAQRHDRLVMAAIQAGAIRRGYLKGLGEAHSCTSPAVPLHLAHPVGEEAADAPASDSASPHE
ncbi:MAG TPA: hypothetical protein VGL58_13060 [Caulobacteraceae bacterium]|jgi:hypothetical protein